MKEQQRAEAVVETVPEDTSRPDGATDIYLIFDGRRIAKRGKPGTLHAMTWISLEPELRRGIFTLTGILSASCLSRIAANLAKVLGSPARPTIGSSAWHPLETFC
jgi:hypothetical protein